MGRSSVGRLGSLTYLVPAIAIAIGWILLGESPQPLSLVGGAIAIAGVIVARSAPRRPAAPAVMTRTEAA
jgi:drug/metabolite transporter (DMT)-like permease